MFGLQLRAHPATQHGVERGSSQLWYRRSILEVHESRRDSWMIGELPRVLKTLEGSVVAFVDGAPGVDPGGRRADHHHRRGGGEHYF
jgi:hypothetical protein